MSRVIYVCLWMLLVAIGRLLAAGSIHSLLTRNYTVKEYNASCQNWDIAISDDGYLFAANNSGLLSFDGNNWRLHRLPDRSELYRLAIHNDTLYSRGESSLGFWMMDEAGDMRYSPIERLPDGLSFDSDRKMIIELPEEIRRLKPTSVASSDELLFVGTASSGLLITNRAGESLHHLDVNNQLQDNIVRSVRVQDKNLLWLALDNGISRIELDPPIAMVEKRNNIGKLENARLKDDRLFIETNRGIFCMNIESDERFCPIYDINPKEIFVDSLSDVVMPELFSHRELLQRFGDYSEIYPRGDDHYWLTKDNEAGLFQLKNGKAILKCRVLFTNYNLNLVSNGKRFIPLNDSLDLVSAMEGTLLINTRRLIEGSLGGLAMPSFCRVSYIDSDGEHIISPKSNSISLPHNFQELSVFAATGVFTSNHQISFRLDGVSDEWSEWQNDGVIKFLQLPEGNYELKVRKYVARGPFPEISMMISVRPPWYNSILAYLLYIILIAITLHLGLRVHLAKLRRDAEARLEAERMDEQQRFQRMRSEMLERELQNKNNELTLQTTALVKRNEAIQSILEELDRQKETLGDRYPNKLYARMRSLIESTLNNQSDWLQFEAYFNSAHNNFMDRLRKQYSDITAGDLRICCLLRMNLSTKEIASLMNVSVRAIEIRRYRLRKRLALDADTNLVDFLMRF